MKKHLFWIFYIFILSHVSAQIHVGKSNTVKVDYSSNPDPNVKPGSQFNSTSISNQYVPSKIDISEPFASLIKVNVLIGEGNNLLEGKVKSNKRRAKSFFYALVIGGASFLMITNDIDNENVSDLVGITGIIVGGVLTLSFLGDVVKRPYSKYYDAEASQKFKDADLLLYRSVRKQ